MAEDASTSVATVERTMELIPRDANSADVASLVETSHDSDHDENDGVSAEVSRKTGVLSRSQRRRQKQKGRKAEAIVAPQMIAPLDPTENTEPPDVTIEYVESDPAAELLESADAMNPELAQFADVLRAFSVRSNGPEGGDGDVAEASALGGDENGDSDTAGDASATGADGQLSRKARKRLLQLCVADLKRSVPRPEVVEAHDVTSSDPKLLAFLKGSRGTVPVPRHWCHKRRYLQGKRGIEKPPFALPDYIAATGITKMRNADLDKGDEKTLKSKTRDRFAPKMGKIEIDYQVLHDAFFVHATKPAGLTKPGELYYEGRELEAKSHTAVPGLLSDALRAALGMDGPMVPPPWLVSQQRYGPPPSYPRLRIPGVSAPLPPGAVYGYQPGGWGKPPVDAYGRPLYGDVFAPPPPEMDGVTLVAGGVGAYSKSAARRLWGEPIAPVTTPQAGDVGASASVEVPGGGAAAVEEVDGLIAAPSNAPTEASAAPSMGGDFIASGAVGGEVSADMSGTATPLDGTLSVSSFANSRISGLETPEIVDIRKGRRGEETPDGRAGLAAAAVPGPAPQLYTVLEEKRTSLRGGLLGTTHAYVVPNAGVSASGGVPGPAPSSSTSSVAAGATLGSAAPLLGQAGVSASAMDASSGIAVALNPDELGDLDEATLANKYESELAGRGVAKEDMSDILEEAERKRKRKLESAAGGAKRSKKDAASFKF